MAKAQTKNVKTSKIIERLIANKKLHPLKVVNEIKLSMKDEKGVNVIIIKRNATEFSDQLSYLLSALDIFRDTDPYSITMSLHIAPEDYEVQLPEELATLNRETESTSALMIDIVNNEIKPRIEQFKDDDDITIQWANYFFNEIESFS